MLGDDDVLVKVAAIEVLIEVLPFGFLMEQSTEVGDLFFIDPSEFISKFRSIKIVKVAFVDGETLQELLFVQIELLSILHTSF